MGTDIEFYVERREGDQWVPCDEWTQNPDPYAFLTGDDFQAEPCWSDRSYDVFSILAGVRSTGDYKAIAPPRGLPDDMSEMLHGRAHAHIDDGYGHSPSWLTLADILAFDWDQTVTFEGYAHASHFHEWVLAGRRDAGIPPPDLFDLASIEETWPDRSLLSEKELLQRTEAIGNPYEPKDVQRELRLVSEVRAELKNCFCHVSWTVTYRDRADNFFRYAVAEMEKHGAPDDVRCVFWFG